MTDNGNHKYDKIAANQNPCHCRNRVVGHSIHGGVLMTHNELIEAINKEIDQAAFVEGYYPFKLLKALRAVVELHKPDGQGYCVECERGGPTGGTQYPCPTIQAIEKELE